MNGHLRTQKKRAATVGLAILMGLTIVGCAGGPRMFARSDRGDTARRREADRSKFVERKRVRPESDYRRDDQDEDQRVARAGVSRTKSGSSRPRTAEEVLAARRRAAEADEGGSRSSTRSDSIARTSANKTSRPGEAVARNEASRLSRRPGVDRLDEDWFAELPPSSTNKKSTSSSSGRSTAAKSPRLDEDPFKNSVIGKTSGAGFDRNNKRIEPVNFDELEDDDNDELDEELEEQEEQRTLTRSGTVNAANLKSKSAASETSTQSKTNVGAASRKSLDDFDDPFPKTAELPKPSDSKTKVSQRDRQPTRDADPIASNTRTSNTRRPDPRKQRSITDWRQELNRDDADELGLSESSISARKSVAAKSSETVKRPEATAFEQESFEPFPKSQGAVLNGELIIETSSLPSRFNRSQSGNSGKSNAESGRVRANSSSSIDIVPGPSQPRSSGQISLQSLSESYDSTSLANAAFEKPSAQPKSPEPHFSEIGSRESTSNAAASVVGQVTTSDGNLFDLDSSEPPGGIASRGWTKFGLILGAVITTILGVLSSTLISGVLRNRRKLAPVPVPVHKQS